MANLQKASTRKRVLLVEDNTNDIELVRWRLAKELDCEVVCATTAEEFEVALEKQPPDAIVSDSGVLGMDGMRALQKARSIQPEVPFIICSGESPSVKITQALQAGATSWIKKDPRYANLIVELNRVWGL